MKQFFKNLQVYVLFLMRIKKYCYLSRSHGYFSSVSFSLAEGVVGFAAG